MVFNVWMNILGRVPGSVMWLLHMPQEAAYSLKEEAVAHGIPMSRLVFSQPIAAEQHLRRCALADLFLDSLHYNAHTTATDALWAGRLRWGGYVQTVTATQPTTRSALYEMSEKKGSYLVFPKC
eukprot:7082862-Pyramimonas_sp.AAC.1